MDIYETIKKRRTIRKFQQRSVEEQTLLKLIDSARISPSAANMQPIKYMIITEPNKVEQIFEETKWAGYLNGAGTPKEGERPTAWILVVTDKDISTNPNPRDVGAAVQTILLTAIAEGLGTCWMGAINRPEISKIVNLDEKYVLDTVIAIGYPDEEPIIEDIKNNDVKYYKDKEEILHIPKRTLQKIVINK